MIGGAPIGTLAIGELGIGDDGDLDEPAAVPDPVPLILVTASVEVYGNVPGEGELVRYVEPVWRAILKLLEFDSDALHKIPPRELEQLVAASYDADGYDEVILTPRSGDGGRDVIATKNGMHSIRIFDQVKAFAANHHVTAHDVRAMLGILHGNVSKGVVTTTAEFAPRLTEDPLLKQFMPHRLELYNGERFLERLGKLREK
ncbi:MAG TPA: restriction endonuclease [Polyangiaceae bacterium]